MYITAWVANAIIELLTWQEAAGPQATQAAWCSWQCTASPQESAPLPLSQGGRSWEVPPGCSCSSPVQMWSILSSKRGAMCLNCQRNQGYQNICHARTFVRVGHKYIEDLEILCYIYKKKYTYLKSAKLYLSWSILEQVHLYFQTFWILLIPDWKYRYKKYERISQNLSITEKTLNRSWSISLSRMRNCLWRKQ